MILILLTSFAFNVISRATWFVSCWNTPPFAKFSHIVSISFPDETDNILKCSECGQTRGELGPGWQPTYPPLAKQMGEGKRLAVQKSLRPLTYTLHFCYNTVIFPKSTHKKIHQSYSVVRSLGIFIVSSKFRPAYLLRKRGNFIECAEKSASPTWRRSVHDVIKWKHFPLNWPFVRGIHRSPVNSPGRGALMFLWSASE